MTEAYQKKATAKAKRAFELLKSGMEPEKVVNECGYVDVPSMLWYLRERGFRFTSGELQEKQEEVFAPSAPGQEVMDDPAEEGLLFTQEERLTAAVNAKERSRLAQRALDGGTDEAVVAAALGYKSVGLMRAGLRKMKARDEDAAQSTLDGSVIKVTSPSIRFGSLTVQSWRGYFFKFSLTEPGGECALPAGHVQAEILQGELSDLVDDVVAGGVLPQEIASKTYERYAGLLRAAADEMESAARVFAGYESK